MSRAQPGAENAVPGAEPTGEARIASGNAVGAGTPPDVKPYMAQGNYYWAPNGLSVPEPEQQGVATPLNALLRALVAGIVIAALGTVLHANVVWLNESTWFPVGIFGSFALAVCLCVLVGASSGRPIFAVITGLIAYIGVGLMMFGIPKQGLIATNTAIPVPSTAMGWVWVISLAFAIAMGYWLSMRAMRKP